MSESGESENGAEDVEMAPAPTPMAMRDREALVEIVRRGGTMHGEKQAKLYANSIENFKKADSPLFQGFFCLKYGRCQLPCALTYNCFPLGRKEKWDDYYCFPMILPIPTLLPIPVVGCCTTGGLGENIYKFEGEGGGPHNKNGHVTTWGSLMVIDEQRGTLTCYMNECSGKLQKHLCITCSRLF